MEFIRAAISVFICKECAVCGRELEMHEKFLCTECLANMPLSYTWNYTDSPADVKFWGRLKVEHVWSLMFYTEKYRECVHSLKYKGNKKIGLYLGETLGRKIAESPINHHFDFIMPIPLHYRKKIKRGYNQAELLARGILNELHDPSIKLNAKILRRNSFTKSQTKKNEIERWQNVEHAFGINSKELFRLIADFKATHSEPPHFLIVDDVLTTGSTLEACAAQLIKACDCRISIATAAYVSI